MEIKVFFWFEIIINVFVCSSRFIWIPMLWVYSSYKNFHPDSAGTNFRRQNLTSKIDPRIKELNYMAKKRLHVPLYICNYNFLNEYMFLFSGFCGGQFRKDIRSFSASWGPACGVHTALSDPAIGASHIYWSCVCSRSGSTLYNTRTRDAISGEK